MSRQPQRAPAQIPVAGRLRLALLATRPRTLGLSLIPVAVGALLAWSEQGRLDPVTLLAALATALLIQVGTNLYNDAVDCQRGVDPPERLGPPRACAQGWFSVTEMRRLAHLAFGLALLTGLWLVSVGGWPILLLGLASLLAGYAYSAGPRPIAYSALGELFVFLFFGLVAVLGSYYLQAARLSAAAWLVAAALGSFAAAVLLVNNFRDLESDRRAGKLTLAHHLGRRRSRLGYALLLLLPFALPLLPPGPGRDAWPLLLALPAALYLAGRFAGLSPGTQCNRLLTQTVQLQAAYGGLLAIALLA